MVYGESFSLEKLRFGFLVRKQTLQKSGGGEREVDFGYSFSFSDGLDLFLLLDCKHQSSTTLNSFTP